jgi:hypothetical protein
MWHSRIAALSHDTSALFLLKGMRIISVVLPASAGPKPAGAIHQSNTGGKLVHA